MFRRLHALRKDARRRRLLAGAGIEVEVPVFREVMGARTGVWPVVPMALPAAPRVWSFGVGDNAAWELAMAARFGARVDAFDPTPGAREWIAAHTWPPGLHFHPVGLGTGDGQAAFRPLRRGRGWRLRRPGERPDPADAVAPVRRLDSLIAEHGVPGLDVLKLDIEGGEYAVLPDALPFPVPVGQLLLEVHHDLPGHDFAGTLELFAALRTAGYRVFWISDRGIEFGWIHERALEGVWP